MFPMNPVWAMRDPGWYELLERLEANPAAATSLERWYPAKSGAAWTDRRFGFGYDATSKLVSLAQTEVFSARSLRPRARLCFEDLRRSRTDPSRRIRSKWTMLNVS